MVRVHNVAALSLCICIMAALPGCLSFQKGNGATIAPAERVVLPGRGRVRVVERNPSAREAVVLLHGYGASSASFKPVLTELSTDLHVLAIDMPGFGASDRHEGDYSPDALADEVARIMDMKGIARASIVGHSWGASVALAFALRHPDRLVRLAIISGWMFDDQLLPIMRWSFVPGIGEALFAVFFPQALGERMYYNFYSPAMVTEAVIDDVRAMAERPGSTAVALAAARGMAQFAANEKRYHDIGVDSLLIWGANDRVSRPVFGERLSRLLPRSRLVLLPACGHLPMWECTPGTLAALRDFLSPLPLAPAAPAPVVGEAVIP